MMLFRNDGMLRTRLAAIATVLLMHTSAFAVDQATTLATTLATSSGQIAGTLTLPSKAAHPAVVLIIAGSGPTDRDGNNPLAARNDNLKLLAEGLADAGYASVRYDKRGIGASAAAAPSEADLRFDTYVDDAAGWIRMLKADPRFAAVSVIGHSEGSLIGMIAARRAGAQAFVSIAGAGQGAADILREQLARQLPAAMAKEANAALAQLEQGQLTDQFPPALGALFRPSVQPYLISWFKFIPTTELSKLEVPVLIVQGTSDVQVLVPQAEALKRARPAATLTLIDGMNHLLKPASSAGDPAAPLAPPLVPAIVQFLSTAAK